MVESGGPLAGVRIIEFAGIGPAPFAAMVLAGMGADVVRIDRPPVGSSTEELQRRSRADILGRDRRSIALNLKTEEGIAIAKKLLSSADGLLEGFRPNVMERLGLGPGVIQDLNPRLTYVRMTGWGQSGPLAMSAGHDLNFIAITGLLNAIGDRDRPSIPLNVVGDFGGGGMFAALGMLAGILNSRVTGRGLLVDAAIVDGVSLFSSMFRGLLETGEWIDKRSENLLDGGAPFYSIYQCRDGRFASVGAIEPKFYEEFLMRLNLDGDERFASQYDRNNWVVMRKVLIEVFASEDAHYFEDLFYGSDCCVVIVNNFGDAVKDPHMNARGSFGDVNGVAHPNPAPRFDGFMHMISPAPFAGQNSCGILEELGISAREITALLEQGVVG